MWNRSLFSSKVQSLSGDLYKFWVNILMIASQHDENGKLPSLHDIAFTLRPMPMNEVKQRLAELSARGLLNHTSHYDCVNDCVDGLAVHDWSDWQMPSDSSTVRVQKFRNKQKKKGGGTVNNGTSAEPSRERTRGRAHESPPFSLSGEGNGEMKRGECGGGEAKGRRGCYIETTPNVSLTFHSRYSNASETFQPIVAFLADLGRRLGRDDDWHQWVIDHIEAGYSAELIEHTLRMLAGRGALKRGLGYAHQTLENLNRQGWKPELCRNGSRPDRKRNPLTSEEWAKMKQVAAEHMKQIIEDKARRDAEWKAKREAEWREKYARKTTTEK